MKCSIVGDRARVLAKFLQFLAKIGPDLYIEAVEEGLILGTANSSSSGFARVHLWPAFFMAYHVLPEQIGLGENCCRVSLKACAAIFRSMKNVETCDIRMNQSASRLIIQLHCRENTTKTHFITILEQETLTAPSRPVDSTVNTLTASQKVFSDILSIFNSTEEELTIEAGKKGVTVQNYLESIHVNRQQMRTQLSLDPAEFDTYVVDTETSLTFCLKEWRAFLILAESLNTNIAIHFETTGLPIEFTIQDLEVFEVTLFMSTLSSDLDSSRNASVVVLNESRAGSQLNASGRPSIAGTTTTTTKKRAHEPSVEEELNALLKKPKGRTKAQARPPSPESRIQFSNPDIEDYSNNNDSANDEGPAATYTTTSHNRITVARNGAEEHNRLDVPTIRNHRTSSTLSPRPPPVHELSNNLEVIFLKDTEDDDSDRTLLSIPMPTDDAVGQPAAMDTIQETVPDGGAVEIPASPVDVRSQAKRKAALSLFRRCYEPSFRVSNITGLNRILAENSSDEEGNDDGPQ